MNPILTGYLLMVAAACLIPLGDAVAKFAHETYDVPITFMAWSRFALGAVLIAPFALRRSVTLSELVVGSVLLRGVLISATVWFILQAVSREDIATAYGAFFIAPLVSFVMAVIFLRERPGALRVTLVCLGFLGVLLVVQPSFSISVGILLALFSGLCYGSFLTISRFLAGHHRPMAMLWAQLIVGGIVMAPFGTDLGETRIAAGLWICVMISAATSAGANLMMVEAYRRVQATRLAPLIYTQLIAATLYGILFFSTLPGLWALLGLGLLIISGFAALLISED